MGSKEIEAVKAFVASINQGDVSLLAGLMTEDHTFVDSGGRTTTGREIMKEGWEEYYRMFPDYRVEIREILQDGNLVAVFGSCSGTYNGKRGLVPENIIAMPAAWKAIVENDKIKFWQVYADWAEGGKIIDEDSKYSG